MAGEIYDCHDAVFLEFKARTRRLLAEYHMLTPLPQEKGSFRSLARASLPTHGYMTDPDTFVLPRIPAVLK